ncbi:MAG: NADP-dependent oxidoreductase [Myxococcota bacterium]
MRAMVLEAYGSPDQLRLMERPEPVLRRDDEVRVAIEAAAINPVDWKIRSGHQRGLIWLRLPAILGFDFAGTVVEVGPKVSSCAVGDAVLGNAAVYGPGSYAEQVVVAAQNVVKRPPALDVAAAAALPLAGLTAYQCLLPWLSSRQGARVFVQAGAGGVGHLAIQIAKRFGAHVTTTASKRNHDVLKGLGADEVIDYRNEEWWTRTYDLVLESLGGPHRDRALSAVERGGRVASINSDVKVLADRYGPFGGLLATGVRLGSFIVRGRLRGIDAATVVRRIAPDPLAELALWAAEGDLTVNIDRTFPLEDLPEAHRYGETGRIRGKVIITMT